MHRVIGGGPQLLQKRAEVMDAYSILQHNHSANKVSSRGEDDNRSSLVHCGHGLCINERFFDRTRRDVAAGWGLR